MRCGRTTGPRSRVPRSLAGAVAAVLAIAVCARADAGSLRLSLEDAIELGMENNRELAIARARTDGADARQGQARAAFLPAVSASGSYTRLDEAPSMDASSFGSIFDPLMAPFEYLVEHGYLDSLTLEGLQGGGGKIYLGDDDIYSIGLSVRQPLFTGGGLLSAHGAVKHAARAEALRASRTAERVRYDIAGAYLGLVQAREALRVMEDTAAMVEAHLSDVEALYEQGMVLESDLMLARVRRAEAELGRTRAEHGVRLAGAALAFVLGVDVETEIEPSDPLAPPPDLAGDLPGWTARALAERSDLKAMSELESAADNAVTLARSGYFPQVFAMGTYAWDRPNLEYEPEFYDHWSVTLAAEMNVFDWGGTASRVRGARAALAETANGRALMEDAVRLEVKKNFLARQETAEELAIAEDAVVQAREGLRVARLSFQSGVATQSAVLDAQASLTSAEMNRIAALAGLRLAEAGLELAAGVAGR